MSRHFLAASAISLFLAVGLGAFGAHGLKGHLDTAMMAIYQTAVQYQFWHGLGLGLIAVTLKQYGDVPLLRWSGWLMLAGIVVFSGSLYVLAITGMRWLGAITPFGGVCFLLAWLLLAVFVWRQG